MVVEFIGSTGAGKTTLLKSVERQLANWTTVTTSTDLVTGLVGLRGITHPTVQNLIQEVLGFPFLVSSLHRHRVFIAGSMKLLRHAKPGLIMVNYVRSLERKLGVSTLVRLIAGDRIILVDEGPVLAAHMLVHGGGSATAREIATFAETIPLPDTIVYVRAPIEAIVERTLARPDAPRELSSHNRTELARYAEAAAALFDQLVASLNSIIPILVVDNPDMDEQHRQAVAEMVASFIWNVHSKMRPKPREILNGSSPVGVHKHHTDAL